MPIPVWVLLAFAGWTLLMLTATVGVYRWSRILSGRDPIKAYAHYAIEGRDWYKRALRAHANCVENLPVLGAIVLAIVVADVSSPTLDVLALTVMGARVLHTTTHVAFEQTNRVVTVRFTFFAAQAVCMLWMGIHTALAVA
ncbi:MAG: MAPEG family protein [Myxococcota bacterium]